jgi:hypothetical protein
MMTNRISNQRRSFLELKMSCAVGYKPVKGVVPAPPQRQNPIPQSGTKPAKAS